MNEKGGHVGDHQTNANCFFHHPLIKSYLKFVDWMNWCVKGIGGLFLTRLLERAFHFGWVGLASLFFSSFNEKSIKNCRSSPGNS